MTTETTKDTSPEIAVIKQKLAPSGRVDIGLGIAVSALAVILYILTTNWTASAAVFPRIVAGILFILGLINAWQGFRRIGAFNQEKFIEKPMDFIKIFASTLAYFFAVWVLGFPIATVALTVGLARLFGFKKWHQSLLAGGIFVAIMLSVFTGLFDRPLPIGLIFAPFFE